MCMTEFAMFCCIVIAFADVLVPIMLVLTQVPTLNLGLRGSNEASARRPFKIRTSHESGGHQLDQHTERKWIWLCFPYLVHFSCVPVSVCWHEFRRISTLF